MSRFTFTGRLVQGDPTQMRQKKDEKTKAPRLKQDGTPLLQAYVAVAIPKVPGQRFVIAGNPSYEDSRAVIDNDARAAWPQFFGQRPQGLQFPASLPMDCTNPKFANKVIDGDGFDDKGQPFSANEGWAGCWVVKCSNGFAPKVYEWTPSGWQETVHTGRTVKCGDYVTVSGNCESNKSTESPGMYMNFDTVSFEQEGAFIASSNSVDPNQALGSRGAPANPPAGQPQGQQGNANAGQTGGSVAGQTGSTTAGAAYSGYRDNAAPAPPADAPAPPPSGPTMTAAATTSYAAYIAAGWTDDQLRAGGLIV